MYVIYKTGKKGESYNIGTGKVITNLNLTKILLKIINDKISLSKKVKIKFVKDRPGHDMRYALDSKKIRKELNWKPSIKFNDGLLKTFEWYFENKKFYNHFSNKKFLKELV